VIRALQEPDAAAFAELRRAALVESPLAFASSPGDDLTSDLDALRAQLRRAPEWTVLGAVEDRLIGVVGIYRDRHLKAKHKAHVWGMYVVPEHRRRGIAGTLLEAALHHARALHGVSQVHLGVTSAAPAARRLYERAGFVVWGTEPEALRHAGQSVIEHHMTLRLDRAAASPP
jgi:RimJ/RimL family protein N-acetyltransferase